MSKLNMPVANHATGFYTDQSVEMVLSSLPAKISKTISNMLTSRQHPTVFILNGKIYVCGGYTSSGVTNSVEIYDPILDTWTSGSPMLEKRSSHTSDIINGIVYVAGGSNASFVHNSIEIFNPSAGVWTKKKNMSISRCGHASFVYNNELYVCGGMPSIGYDRLSTMEKYNPSNDTWVPRASMMKALTTHSAIKSGTKVYVSGGASLSPWSWYIKDTYIYDCVLDSWTRGSDLNRARADHIMNIVDNKIHVMGGFYDSGVTGSVEFMDSTSGIWYIIQDLYTPRQLVSAGNTVYNDTLYIIGGWSSSTPYTNMVTTFKNGSFSNSHDVEITPTIRYTIDGSEPSINSNLYTNPFIANIPSVVKAKSVLSGYTDSDTLIVSLENTIKEIINFDPSKLFSNDGVLSNVNVFTRLELDIKSEYNTLKDYDSQKCINMKNTMILGMKSMSNGEVIALQNISDDILSSEWYVLVIDKSDISVGIDRTPKHNLNVVGRCDIDIRDIFLPYTSDRLIYKFNAGPRGVDLLQKLSIKLAMDDVDFQGRYTFKTFAIFKLADFEKYIIKDFNKITLNISDPDLNSDDTLLKNEAISEFKKNINDTVKKCIHEYLPGHESLYTKTILTHRVKDTDNMTEISCKFYRDANMTDLVFEDILFSDSFNSEQDTTGYISMNVVSPISITDILKSITVEEVILDDRFGDHKKYTLEMNTSEVFKVKELSKLSIPAKTKTERASLELNTINNDVGGIDNTSLFFSGGGISQRITPAPVLVEYDNLNTVTPDTEANTYHKNNPEPFVFKNTMLNKIKPTGNITDTFDTYREFYYETVDKTYVPNIDESHEWFRLYGSTREDAIKNVFAIKRKDKNSMLIVNGIPIQYTSLRLVEYLEHEYIVVNSENDIRTLGELHVYNFSTYPSDAALFIHRDGVVNTSPTDGYCIGDYKEVLEFGKGVHYIPDGYVSIGRNYLVVDNSNKIKYYPKRVAGSRATCIWLPVNQSGGTIAYLINSEIW